MGAFLIGLSLTACAPNPDTVDLSYDGGLQPKVRVCVDLAMEVARWSDRGSQVRAVVTEDEEGFWFRFHGSLESASDATIYRWTCEVRSLPGDESLAAELIDFQVEVRDSVPTDLAP